VTVVDDLDDVGMMPYCLLHLAARTITKNASGIASVSLSGKLVMGYRDRLTFLCAALEGCNLSLS
jgi:hypothetical protein